jgi:hypothetical protein
MPLLLLTAQDAFTWLDTQAPLTEVMSIIQQQQQDGGRDGKSKGKCGVFSIVAVAPWVNR